MGSGRRQRLIWGFLGSMLLLFIVASWASSYYIDWLWFRSLGYAGVFWRSLAGRWLAALGGALLFGGVVFVNLWIAVRDASVAALGALPFPYQRWFRPRALVLAAAGLSLGLGAMAGIALSSQWLLFPLLRHRVGFGVSDPLFGNDVSFYVFVLPVLNALHQLLSSAAVLSLLAAGGVYALSGRVHLDARWFALHPRARVHLAVLLGFYLLLKAGGYWIATYRLLFSPRGAAFGASYTDIYAQLPALKVLVVLALLTAALAFLTPVFRNYRLLVGAGGAMLAASVLLGNVVPVLVQNFVVRPNEIAKETPFIALSIRYTRQAYNLDRIREEPFPADTALARADIEQEGGTIGNIRLWDWRVLQSAFQQLQGIRTYYTFGEVDVDRYRIGGELRQVVLSAREVSYDKLPGKTWINQHLKYTHGYGVVVSPASQVTREGQPPLWVKDIPPSSVEAAPELRVTRPEIYFGEHTDPYAIVNTLEREFDYPKGDENEYTAYRGRDGIPVGRGLARLAFALWTGDYNVLFSRALTRESRALIHRNIAARVERIAPFLVYDHDPYLVVSGGHLYWVQDAYTVTGAYPYSEPPEVLGENRFNYIRNSVKAVIDAYDGTVTFYLADPEDPLIRAYARVFPGLFQPLERMDPDLRAHLRYPEDLFLVQMERYAKYHMQDPVVFYNREDMWDRPKEKVGVDNKLQPVDPYYVIMQLPGARAPEFLLMVPYTPKGRQNMIAWLAVRADGEHYGDLLVYKFPKQKVVYGPEQVEALIDQNDAIAEKLNLWNQQGSQVQRGNLLVIPVRDSLLYVEPIYLQSSTTKLPELRRVVVAYGNRVIMDETLEGALQTLFGAAPGGPAGPGGAGPAGPAGPAGAGGPSTPGATGGGPLAAGKDVAWLAAEAGRLYREAQEALRQGDWAGYGRRIEELGAVLRRLEEGLSRQPAGGGAAPGGR